MIDFNENIWRKFKFIISARRIRDIASRMKFVANGTVVRLVFMINGMKNKLEINSIVSNENILVMWDIAIQ